MEKKTRLIILGSVIGVLTVVVLYLNFCSGGGKVDSTTAKDAQAVRTKVEAEEKAAPPVEVPPPPPELKAKSGFPRKSN